MLTPKQLQRLASGAAIKGLVRGGGTLGSLGGFLGQLGPAGRALKMLIRGQSLSGVSSTAIQDAVSLLEASGFEVRMPSAPGIPTQPPAERRRSRPDGRPNTGAPMRPRTGAPGEPPSQRRGLPQPQDPSQTGAFPGRLYVGMEKVTSSNVYAIGYDPQTLTMRVQYLATALNARGVRGSGHVGKNRVRGTTGKTLTGKRGGPGPLYDYKGVPPRVFERIRSATSKGKAIWDGLRIRGTVFGHKYDYELVAASVADVIDLGSNRKVAQVTYVPRRAVGPGQFQGRTLHQGVGKSARTFRSLLPNEGMR